MTEDIQPDAFNTIEFSKTTALKLSMPLRILRAKIFKGMPNIRFLNFYNMRLGSVDAQYLFGATALLHLFIYGSFITPAILHNLTASSNLRHLPKLTLIKNNIRNVIRNDTFATAINLEQLELDYNQITEIAPRTFYSFRFTLKTINLRGNLLKTLPDGLFPEEFLQHSVLDHKVAMIQQNPWHCSCELNYLRQTQIDHPERFLTREMCATPEHLRARLIHMLDLCGGTANTTDMPGLFIKCLSRQQHHHQQPHDHFLPTNTTTFKKPLKLLIDSNGDLIMILRLISQNYTLIWMDMDSQKYEIIPYFKCIHSYCRTMIKLNLMRNLKSNNIYTFCMMDKNVGEVSPLHCLSHHTFELNTQLWFTQNISASMWCTIVVSLLVAYGLGAGLTIILARAFFQKPAEAAHDEPFKETDSTYYCVVNRLVMKLICGSRTYAYALCIWSNVIFIFYRSCGALTRMNDMPPPLPPHPKTKKHSDCSTKSNIECIPEENVYMELE